MHICILGGSGKTGRKVITEALDRGRTVTTLVRHPEKLDDTPWQDSVRIVQGDATLPADLMQLASGDIIVDTTSVGLRHSQPTNLYSGVAQALIAVWEQLSAQHLFVMSSTGTHHGRDLPSVAGWGYEWLLGDVADDKELAEQYYAASGLPWTIIKATKLWPGTLHSYRLQTFSEYTPSLLDWTTRKTVARVIADCIASGREYSGEKLVVR